MTYYNRNSKLKLKILRKKKVSTAFIMIMNELKTPFQSNFKRSLTNWCPLIFPTVGSDDEAYDFKQSIY